MADRTPFTTAVRKILSITKQEIKRRKTLCAKCHRRSVCKCDGKCPCDAKCDGKCPCEKCPCDAKGDGKCPCEKCPCDAKGDGKCPCEKCPCDAKCDGKCPCEKCPCDAKGDESVPQKKLGGSAAELTERHIDDVRLAICMFNETTLIQNFIKQTHDRWEQIRTRDLDHFVDNLLTIFQGLPEDYVQMASQFMLLRDNTGALVIDIEKYWPILEDMVRAALVHVYNMREPEEVNGIIRYRNKEYFKAEVKLLKLSTDWDVEFSC